MSKLYKSDKTSWILVKFTVHFFSRYFSHILVVNLRDLVSPSGRPKERAREREREREGEREREREGERGGRREIGQLKNSMRWEPAPKCE